MGEESALAKPRAYSAGKGAKSTKSSKLQACSEGETDPCPATYFGTMARSAVSSSPKACHSGACMGIPREIT